jgi:two-component system OmpR family sensor kinase
MRLRGVPSEPGVLGLAVDAGGIRWRLYAVTLADGNVLLAAMPLEEADAASALFRRLIPLVAAAGALVALTAGYLVAGTAIRPLRLLTEVTAEIGRVGDFSRRVPQPGRNDELGRLAATFNAMLASLEKAYRTQQRFTADASHELRAPLTVIQANLDLLRRHPEIPSAEREQAIAQADREAARLARLVGDLLTLARADAGVTMRRWPVELDGVVLEAVAEAGRLAGNRRVGVGWLEPVMVEGDPDRLKQLTLILLDNAIKYTPEGGSIVVELRRQGGSAELVVRDSGVGIRPDELPHVFERFYRGEAARKLDPEGTGLGLPIALWVARQHGGDLSIESEPGKGTTVRVRLPLRRQ